MMFSIQVVSLSILLIQSQVVSSNHFGSPQVAQAPLGTINMTLYNNVIKRFCMGIQQSYKIVQKKGKNIKIDLTFLVVCKTRHFRTFLASFSFSVFLSII